jgi:asparagine synthase (glutamine-hydrolysing)
LDETCESFYDGIAQIPAGTSFEVDMAGEMRAWRYWSLPLPSGEPVKDPAQAFSELFEDAVRLRMRSDVPVGVCLSGGLDSTSIICAMARQWNGSTQPLHAFAYQAPEFDESAYISDTLKMTRAHLNRLETDPLKAWSALDKVLSFHDEPVHAMSAVLGFELMGLAASRGVKVVLNGQGADEVIGGYSSYFRDYWFTLLNSGKLSETWREIGAFASYHRADRNRLFLGVVRHLLGVALNRSEAYRGFARWRRRRGARRHSWFSADLGAHLADDTPDDADWTLDAILRRSVERGPLPLYLRLEDRNSMAHSVESRLPFMDYRLVSLVFNCADRWKLRGPWNKYLLRESMQRRIPESVRTRIDKWGFPVPQGKWISGPWYAPLLDLLGSRQTRERGIYNVAAIQRDLELHRQGSMDATGALFAVVQFELWARRLDSSRAAPEPALG